MITTYNDNPKYSLRLIDNESGRGVDLVIVDREGRIINDGYVLGVDETGVTRYTGIDPAAADWLRLSLDADGDIALSPDDNSAADNDQEDEW